MTLRPPRPSSRTSHSAALDYEIAQEQAVALGRLGRALERALAARGRVGGHFVQGHVDCTARVISFERSNADHRLEVALQTEFAQYAVYKGSIAINGISLSIAEVLPESLVIWIIPHTRQHTNIDAVQPGDLINIEFDILAKYVERMLASYVPQS